MHQLQDAEPPATLAAPAPEGSPNSLKAEYNKMFTSGEYSDLAVKLQDGKLVRVHKAIVCRGAHFLVHALSGLPKSQGDESNTIEMILDPPVAMRALLQFLYIGDYGVLKDTDESQKALHHLQIYLIGDKYNLPLLQSIAEERFETALANEHLDLIRMVPEAVETAYHKDSDAHIWARELLTAKCVEKLQVLTQSDEFPVLLGRFKPFAFDVIKATAQKQQDSQTEALKISKKSLEDTRAELKKSESARRQLQKSLSTTEAWLKDVGHGYKTCESDLLRVRDQLTAAQSQLVTDRQKTIFVCPNSNCLESHVPHDFEKVSLQCSECQRSYAPWKWFINSP